MGSAISQIVLQICNTFQAQDEGPAQDFGLVLFGFFEERAANPARGPATQRRWNRKSDLAFFAREMPFMSRVLRGPPEQYLSLPLLPPPRPQPLLSRLLPSRPLQRRNANRVRNPG